MRFKIPEDMLPVAVPLPKLPTADEMAHDPEKAKTSFDAAMEFAESRHKQNQENFERAMPRIERCAFLQGFKRPFVFTAEQVEDNMNRHYSWCPAPHWDRSIQENKHSFLF